MKIKRARMVMRRAFERDPDFRFGYQANIAMLIYDNQKDKDGAVTQEMATEDLRTKEGCNAIADRIIDLVFGK